MTDHSDDSNLIGSELAARLLMITSGQLADLTRRGFVTPVTKNPAKYRLVEVVQGYIKSLQHEQTRPRNQSEAAKYIFINTRNFRDLVDREVLPRRPASEGYNLDEVREKYIMHLRAVASNHGEGSSTGALTSERAALAREQREAVQFKNAVARGDYVPRSEVKRQIVPRLEITRERFLSIPGKLSDQLAHRSREEVEEILEQEVIEALNELATPIEFDGGPNRTQ